MDEAAPTDEVPLDISLFLEADVYLPLNPGTCAGICLAEVEENKEVANVTVWREPTGLNTPTSPTPSGSSTPKIHNHP